MNAAYIEIVRLLLEAIPVVFQEPQFAMKGGTALNLFIQDLPRLSVDIDVVFIDHTASRTEALRQIGASLEAARNELNRRGLQAESSLGAHGDESKLFRRRGSHLVKVEVNHVFRGTMLPVQVRSLTPESRRLFTTEVHVPVLATAELYGSQLVAALHRQHPRDLFDVHCMFETGGINDEMVECFVGYLAGHHRPLHDPFAQAIWSPIELGLRAPTQRSTPTPDIELPPSGSPSGKPWPNRRLPAGNSLGDFGAGNDF